MHKYIFFILLLTSSTISPDTLTINSTEIPSHPPAEFWGFPEEVQYNENSGLWFSNELPEVDLVRSAGVTLPWSLMNPAEGTYDFSLLEDYLTRAEAENISLIIRLPSSVTEQNGPFSHGDEMVPFVPEWVIKKHNPPQFYTLNDTRTGLHIKVAAPWDENLQNEYRLFISEFGSRGYIADRRIKGIYIHGISSSFGEEFWLNRDSSDRAIKAGMTEEKLFNAFRNRIDWWCEAAGEERWKLVWITCGNIGDTDYTGEKLNQYALSSGLGWREGGMESYHRNIPPHLGQTYNNGYVTVDWDSSYRDGVRYFGEEIENRLIDLYAGFTELEQKHFTQSSLMRAAQLGMNYLWTSEEVVNSAPAMFRWWIRIAGKNDLTAPDAVCWLREDYFDSGGIIPWKNMERFLFQRDLPGAMTKPVLRIDRPEFYTDPENIHYDYTARSTDIANGSNSMLFLIDDTFRKKIKNGLLIKVYYFDDTHNIWQLQIPSESDVLIAGEIQGTAENRWKTLEIEVPEIPETRPEGTNFDFRLLIISGGDLTVKFFRAIKL